jgi:hypothetical protein
MKIRQRVVAACKPTLYDLPWKIERKASRSGRRHFDLLAGALNNSPVLRGYREPTVQNMLGFPSLHQVNDIAIPQWRT